MSVCKVCGAEIAEGSKFCTECGAPVEAAGTVSEVCDKIEEKVEGVYDDVKDAAEDAAGDVEKVADKVEEKVEGVYDDVKDKVEEKAEDVKEKAEDVVEDVKEKIEDVKEKVEDKVEEIKEKAEDAAEDIKAGPAEEAADPKDVENNKWISALSYLGLLVLVPFFVKKDSKFAQYHARQGFNLLAVGIAAGIVMTILDIVGGVFYGIAGATGKGLWAIPGVLLYLVAGAIGIALTVFAIIGIVNALSGKAKELPLIGKLDILRKVFKK